MSSPETNQALGEIEVPVKRGKGRPITINYKLQGSEYFAQKFRERNIYILCECGTSIQRYNMKAHQKTNKHMYCVLISKMTPPPDI